MASLRIEHLVKSFGAIRVLGEIDLDVADGEFVVLVGPSGCGKSTLLRLIAGLETVSAGRLWIGERLANALPPQRRNVSMVFQSYALFPHMDVRRNMGFGPRVRGEPQAQVEAKVARAAATIGLAGHLARFPRQLSGGQRQRVAMGRTVVREPDLFLFDEPLSNLDAQLRVQLRTEIKALHQTLRSTVVYVTHDQVEAMTLADRIVVMNAGRIEQEGPPLTLYDRPATRFVAAFLGSPSMSFLPGTVTRESGPARLRLLDGATIPLPDTRAADGQAVEVGLRPEHVRLEDGPHSLRFHVEVVEPTGAETHLFGHAAGSPLRAVFRDRLAVRPGDRLPLAADPALLHVFDAGSGQRL